MKVDTHSLIKNIVLLIIILSTVPLANATMKMVLNTETPLAAVDGMSMHPTLEPGDLLIVQGIDPKSLKVGDIIVFSDPYTKTRLIVHRIVDIYTKDGNLYFKTKGDNNPFPDSWSVRSDLIQGKVIVRIPMLGWFSIVFKRNPILMILFMLFIIILIITWPKGGSIFSEK